MKISATRLKEIIQEEIYNLKENPSTEEEAQNKKNQEEEIKTKTAMRDKFKDLYKAFMDVKGTSIAELKLFNALIDMIIEDMQQGEIAPILKRAMLRINPEKAKKALGN